MRARLALASLTRRPARSGLAILGVAVVAAMLLDMVMLSSGMRESFRELLLSRNFAIRLSPRGTLPFDTEATVANASAVIDTLRTNPGVEAVSPVLGAALHIRSGDSAVTAIGLGMLPDVQGEYELQAGSDPLRENEILFNSHLLVQLNARPGDSIRVAVGYDPQIGSFAGERVFTISGEGRFVYLAREQRAAAINIGTLQTMFGPAKRDRASLFMVRLRPGTDVTATREWITNHIPTVTATSIDDALRHVDERLSYFRQMAFILGSVSLVVAFLLITTIVTMSVNERIGEIAVMRAIGVSRTHVLQQIVVEALLLSSAGTVAGFLLGLVTARYLNGILSQFPGLPTAIDFFLFQPGAVWRALGMLVASSFAAAMYPALRAASLPIAETLRREAVA